MNILLVLLYVHKPWMFSIIILSDPPYYGHVGWNMWEENQMQLWLTTSVHFVGYFVIQVCMYKAWLWPSLLLTTVGIKMEFIYGIEVIQ
jgi:hypothetical protein